MVQDARFLAGILLTSLVMLSACDEEEPSGESSSGGSPQVGSAGMGGDDSNATGGDSQGTGGSKSEGTGGKAASGGSKGEGSGGKAATGGSTGSGGAGDTPEIFDPAATGILNDTGAWLCYSPDDEIMSCEGSGQDGEFGRDVTFNDNSDGFAGFSYSKVCHSGEVAGTGSCPADPELGSAQDDWGCTLDKVTGLLWELKTNDGGPRDVSKVYAYGTDPSSGDARTYVSQVNSATLCGGADWRLPRVDELESLLVYKVLTDPETEQQVQFEVNWFPNTIRTVSEAGDDDSYEAVYWSRESGLIWSGYYYNSGWFIDFMGGQGHRLERDDEESLLSVRLVRGTSIAKPTLARFTVSSDSLEVTDKATGLTWKRCAEGQTWDGETCAGLATEMSGADAFSLANATVGWRLANAKELMSLYYFAAGDNEGTLQLDLDVFPNSFPQINHHSSTQAPWRSDYYYKVGTMRLPQAEQLSYLGNVRLVRE